MDITSLLSQIGVSAITSLVVFVLLYIFNPILRDYVAHRIELNKEKKIHISKVQFDKEYKIYEEIWSALVDLNLSTLNLRPYIDSIPKDKTRDELKFERLTDFSEKFNRFSDLVEKNKPFFAQSVYSKLSQIRSSMTQEAMGFEFEEGRWFPKDKEGFLKMRQNLEGLSILIDETCEMIRNRISDVTIK